MAACQTGRELSRSLRTLLVAAALLPIVAAAAEAAPATGAVARPALPRWEWGVGIAAAHLRDFPGSSHRGSYALPWPWFTWRSERLEVGRDGGRGILYRTPQFEVDFTLAANPPAATDDNPERAGMPDLDALLEPGLRAHWRYGLDDAGRWRLDLKLPVRQAISIDGDLRTHAVGARLEPGASLDYRPSSAWTLGMSVAAGIATAGYNDFYYGVAPPYASATRPVYVARGGYTGWQAGLRASWRRNNLTASLFARAEHVGDAAFADSPLVTTNHGYTLGASLGLRIGQSRETVAGVR